jgi:methylphosphotriester-DNA--protein-cysteine methyltransferase
MVIPLIQRADYATATTPWPQALHGFRACKRCYASITGDDAGLNSTTKAAILSGSPHETSQRKEMQ